MLPFSRQEQTQEIKFKLNQVFRRNRNSDPKPETKADHIGMYPPEISEMGEVGPFHGMWQEWQNLFTFISESCDILQNTFTVVFISCHKLFPVECELPAHFYDPTQKFLIRFNERDLIFLYQGSPLKLEGQKWLDHDHAGNFQGKLLPVSDSWSLVLRIRHHIYIHKTESHARKLRHREKERKASLLSSLKFQKLEIQDVTNSMQCKCFFLPILQILC